MRDDWGGLIAKLNQNKTIFVTGGLGFIGSNLIRKLLGMTSFEVVNLDKISYASNIETLKDIDSLDRYHFIHGDICDRKLVESIFRQYTPNIVMHLAAESHVDRSIDDPINFLSSNIFGTMSLLEEAKIFYHKLQQDEKKDFIFHHISTDEVYGSISGSELFTEEHPYNPSSPYAASKASSDHLVRAWHKTFHLPVVVTNCSNNYGPYQFPEKLIPLMILNALNGRELPIYGSGDQIRDWLFVDDHVDALILAALEGKPGETYNIGGNEERSNIEVVTKICFLMQDLKPLRYFILFIKFRFLKFELKQKT